MHPVHVVAKANMTFPQYPHNIRSGRNSRIRSRIRSSHPNISNIRNNRSIRSRKSILMNFGLGA